MTESGEIRQSVERESAASVKQSAGDQPQITLVELIVFLLIWVMFLFRAIALPFLVLAFWCSRRGSSRVARYGSRSLLLLSLLVPFDVRFADFSGAHRGTPQNRIGVVPYVNGVPPAHTRLIQEYGEYYTGGWARVCAFPPRSIVSISLKPRSPDQ